MFASQHRKGNSELPEQSKICQLIIERIITPQAVWADDLCDTERGPGALDRPAKGKYGTSGSARGGVVMADLVNSIRGYRPDDPPR
jgi:hypothetical protein